MGQIGSHMGEKAHSRNTGFFVLENDKVIFWTHTPHRTNYRSEWAQIWHGCPFWQSIWGYRGVFRNSAQEPRYGVPLGGPPQGPKISNFFFLQNLDFFEDMVSTMSILKEMSKCKLYFLYFWWISGVLRSYGVTLRGPRMPKNLIKVDSES